MKKDSIFDMLTNIFCFDFSFLRKKKVAILRLSGVIGKGSTPGSNGLSIESLNPQIEKMFKISNLECVCLVINSPGGSPVQSELIALRITNLSKEKKIPVYCFVEDVAASGGYWLACSGNEIYASQNSIIGSIGVISAGFGLVKTIEKLGIERRVYTSGNNKSVLDPFLEEKESDVNLIKKIQVEVHGNFIDYVKTRRQGKLTQDEDFLFNGEFWTGRMAYEYGLIDGIDDVYGFIKRNFGSKVRVEHITPKESWIKKQFGILASLVTSSFTDAIHNKALELAEKNRYDLR
ncbi:MAG: S49 family peptidase [Alphaproteobacteria bacterium]|nr:S49 family peptidase [Alphaproteobacteria bacterium]